MRCASDSVENEIRTETIFSKLAEERRTGELLPLPKNFYLQLEESMKKGVVDGGAAELQNKKTTLNTLKSKRVQKILVYIAFGKSIPSPIPYEEEELYTRIIGIISKEAPQSRTVKIKILINMPEFITTNGNKIGPYKEGEIVQTDVPSDAEFIINNKIGEIVDP